MTTNKAQGKQNDFRKLLEKLSPKNSKTSLNVSHHVFFKHFRSLLNSNPQRELSPDSIEIGSLDYNITLKELENASVLLKAGKTVGIDTCRRDAVGKGVEHISTNLLVNI